MRRSSLTVAFITLAVLVATAGGFSVYRLCCSAPSTSPSDSGPTTAGDRSAALGIHSPSGDTTGGSRGPGLKTGAPLALARPRTVDLTHVEPALYAAALGNDPGRIFGAGQDDDTPAG